jgi:hypothetical protein
MWRKHRDSVLASIGGEDETTRFRDERTGHSRQSRDRFDVPIFFKINHVDRVVTGVCDVEPISGRMDIGMIKSTLGSICWKFNVTE